MKIMYTLTGDELVADDSEFAMESDNNKKNVWISFLLPDIPSSALYCLVSSYSSYALHCRSIDMHAPLQKTTKQQLFVSHSELQVV